MIHATRLAGLARSAGNGMIRFAHGGLLSVGVAAAAHFGVDYLKHDPVSFADIGLINAHAAVPDVPSVGDRWRVASGALVGAGENALLNGELALADEITVSAEPALSDEMARVRDWVASRYRVSSAALEPVLAVAEASASEAGLDPLLIVAMMAIESSFNPRAESHMGAQGLMQVIPRWHMDKIGEDAGADALFDPLINVQVGTLVLVEGLQRYGSLQAALQYYGGARNDPEARYAKRVLAMKRQLASAARALDDA